MISEASSAVQGLLAQVGGKTEQKSGGPGGFLALLQGDSGGHAGKSDAQALLASLTGSGNQGEGLGNGGGDGDGATLQGEALQSALRSALSTLSGQGGPGGGQAAIEGEDGALSAALTDEALEDLAGTLVNLAEALESGNQAGNQEDDTAPAGLLNALARLSGTWGKEQAVEAVTQALTRFSQDGKAAQGAQPNRDGSSRDAAELSQLQDKLDNLVQQLENLGTSPAPANPRDQADGAAQSLPDLLDGLEAAVAQLKEAAEQGSARQELLSDLQAQLAALQETLEDKGQELDLASLLAAAEAKTPTTGKAAPGQAAAASTDALAELGPQLDSLLQGLKATRSGSGEQNGNLQAISRAEQGPAAGTGKGAEAQTGTALPDTAGKSQDAARGGEQASQGEQASRQAAVTASAEQQEQLAQRQQTSQSLSDKQAAELFEALRQTGKALQNEAATQALERSLARLSDQAGSVNRLAEALSSLQGREESLTPSSGSRGPESLNALSFENQLRASAQAQQAAAQAQQAAKSQGGPAADQIAMKIHKAVAGGNERISVQLHPAELGRVDVKMEFGQDGLLRASITAERPETLDMLQRDARALERALSDAGVKTDSGSLNFNTRDTAGQQQAFDQGRSGAASGGNAANGTASGDDTVPEENDANPRAGSGLINMSV